MITSLAGEEGQVVLFLEAVWVFVHPQPHRGLRFAGLRRSAVAGVSYFLPHLPGFEGQASPHLCDFPDSEPLHFLGLSEGFSSALAPHGLLGIGLFLEVSEAFFPQELDDDGRLVGSPVGMVSHGSGVVELEESHVVCLGSVFVDLWGHLREEDVIGGRSVELLPVFLGRFFNSIFLGAGGLLVGLGEGKSSVVLAGRGFDCELGEGLVVAEISGKLVLLLIGQVFPFTNDLLNHLGLPHVRLLGLELSVSSPRVFAVGLPVGPRRSPSLGLHPDIKNCAKFKINKLSVLLANQIILTSSKSPRLLCLPHLPLRLILIFLTI